MVRGTLAGLVGNWVSGLHYIYRFTVGGMTIWDDNSPGKRSGPNHFEYLRHGGRRLARTDDDCSAGWRGGQVIRQADFGGNRVDARFKQVL
jgi:hypothetical protein